MNNTILEYLEGYFGGELNESITDDNIMEAFNELLETANAVEEFMVEMGPKTAEMAGRAVALTREKPSAIFGDLVGNRKRAQAKRVALRMGKREPAQIGGSPTQQAFNRGVRKTNLKRQGLDPNTPISSMNNTIPIDRKNR